MSGKTLKGDLVEQALKFPVAALINFPRLIVKDESRVNKQILALYARGIIAGLLIILIQRYTGNAIRSLNRFIHKAIRRRKILSDNKVVFLSNFFCNGKNFIKQAKQKLAGCYELLPDDVFRVFWEIIIKIPAHKINYSSQIGQALSINAYFTEDINFNNMIISIKRL